MRRCPPGGCPGPAGASPGTAAERPALHLPEDAVEWVEARAALRREVTHPRIYPFREQVARACDRVALALRAGLPEPTQPEPGDS